jgi:hypothetical protein
MRYAIVINLDYVSHPQESCNQVWDVIKQRMIDKGFRYDGRLFSIELPDHEACDLARDAIESIEEHHSFEDKRVYMYIRDFYGFNMDNMTNLLLPPSENIEISEE